MKQNNNITIKNKKAYHEYFITDTYEAGIVLVGTEIKSIRLGKANLADSYCHFVGNELFVVGMHISEYENASFSTHDPKRERKVLLTKRELKRLKVQVNEKGYTIVPTQMYIKKGLCKVEIALAKGKHTYDKKQSLKEKDIKRELERI